MKEKIGIYSDRGAVKFGTRLRQNTKWYSSRTCKIGYGGN